MDLSEILKMLGDPAALQARAEEMRSRMAAITVVGSSGGGMVKVVMNGSMELLSIEIAPEVVDPAELTMLQDLVRAAHADALARIRESLGSEISGGLPGFPGFGG
ncbi:MAG: YbaB/EbfC family nucleoid-associated protein [Spirochaetes bacterium]|nr:YbaB/EbfC family nucleoid-associated protein [Spirochaetota bacterium]